MRHLNVLEHEREATRRSARVPLTDDEVQYVAVIALASLALHTVGRVMYFSKYATLQPVDFGTYHEGAAWVSLAANVLFMYAAWRKGITYWLVHAVAVLGVISSVVLIALMHGWLHPSDLRMFDFGPRWWRG